MRERESSYDRKSDRAGDRMAPRKRSPPIPAGQILDYKDHELLRKFMTERGKIMPNRFTGASAKQQRQIKRAIRRARVMGLLP